MTWYARHGVLPQKPRTENLIILPAILFLARRSVVVAELEYWVLFAFLTSGLSYTRRVSSYADSAHSGVKPLALHGRATRSYTEDTEPRAGIKHVQG